MGTIGDALASKFEQVNEQLITVVAAMSDAQWRAVCPGEQWPAGVVAHHVAARHPMVSAVAQMMAMGMTPPPMTAETLDHNNAEHAQHNAASTRAETLALLRHTGTAAAEVVRSLSDKQLARTAPFFGQEPSARGDRARPDRPYARASREPPTGTVASCGR